MSSEETCNTCKWWDGFGTSQVARCHASPPTMARELRPHLDRDVGMWPRTWKDKWCGGWAIRED